MNEGGAGREELRYINEDDLLLLAQSCPPQFLSRLYQAARQGYDDPYMALMGLIDLWEGSLESPREEDLR